MHYHNVTIQIGPDDSVKVERQSCGDGDNWVMIRECPVEYGILINGATSAEVDAIVAAINAPIMRRRDELAAKIAAWHSERTNIAAPNIFDEMIANPPVIVEEQTR